MDVSLPDGTVIKNVPDGTTKADLIGKLQNNGYDVSALVRQTAGDMAASEMSGPEKFFAGAGKAMTDVYRGGKQLLGMGDQQDINESRQRDQGLMKTGAGLAGNIVGGMATAAPAAFIPGANTLVGSSLFGAGLGALQPTVEGESRGLNSMLGGAGGALGYGVGKAAGRVITPTDNQLTSSQARALEKAQALGARATPGTASGSTGLRQLEASAESFPITAGPFAKLKSNNETILGRSAAKAIGENADNITSDVLNAARTRIGSVFDDVRDNLKAIPIGEDFSDKLAKIDAKYKGVLDKPLASYDIVSDISAKLGTPRNVFRPEPRSGVITGAEYTDWQSQLNKAAQAKFRSDPSVGFALAEVKNLLDDAASAAMGGTQKKAFDTARQQWKNLVMLEGHGAVNEQAGQVNGKVLANILSRKDKQGFRLGGNSSDLYDMARFSKAFPDVVGNSGTATRSALPMIGKAMLYSGVGGGIGGGVLGMGQEGSNPHYAGNGAALGMLAPLALAALGRGAAGAYTSPMLQPYLNNQILTPAMRQAIASGSGLLGADMYLQAGQ